MYIRTRILIDVIIEETDRDTHPTYVSQEYTSLSLFSTLPPISIYPYKYTVHGHECPLNLLLAQVNRYYERGEYEQAMKASCRAKYLNIAGIAAFAIVGCIAIVIMVTVPLSVIRR